MKSLIKFGFGATAPAKTYPKNFFVNLTGPTGVTLSNTQSTVTINQYTPPAGLAAAMAAALAGNSSSGTGGITTSLTVIRSSGTAPLAVWLDATGTTNSLGIDSFYEIYYFWNFGDGEVAWTYGTLVGDNSKNRARGPVATHVYETAGSYTPKVTPITVSSGGVMSIGATSSVTITATAANTTYSGANTIAVSSTGTPPTAGSNGVPAGATCVANVTSLNAALAYANANNKRVMLARGETYTNASSYTMNYSGVQIEAYGSGAAPVVTQTGTGSGTAAAIILTDNASDFRIIDVKFNGGTGAKFRSSIDVQGAGYGTPISRFNVLMLRVECVGTYGISNNMGFTDGVFLVDSNIHEGLADGTAGNGGVGFYTEHCKHVACLGTRIYDMTGIEHCLRFQGSSDVVVSNNYLYKPATNKNTLTARGRSVYATPGTWSGVWCENIVVSDNFIDAGAATGPASVAQFAPQNTVSDERIRKVLFERNYVTGNAPSLLNSEVCSTMVARNNLFFVVQAAGAGQYTNGVITLLAQNTAGTPAGTSTFVYNNSGYEPTGYVDQFSLVNILKSGTLDYPTGTVIKNNLASTKSATKNAQNSGTPTLLITQASGSYYTLSNNSSDSQVASTAPGFTEPPTTTFTTWKPTTGYAINAGTYVPVLDDFFGAARPATFSLGAVNT